MPTPKVTSDVPVIGYRALLIMHLILAAFIALVTYIDWHLPQ
ncbi:hypothetical protein AA101099_2563 [Neoasaia chiangmaiensis NBRC 101099]|nr:hypothetical protein [Neoasaia chiangmaiensis]GBR41641.1 hypothetical protein AA101099_2563 [Neoasaia chiangmaiensis NBRC 101099]GEN14360.1 hypothetical protein NCH01_07910 [Neoasaia chiangmaiensis]